MGGCTGRLALITCLLAALVFTVALPGCGGSSGGGVGDIELLVQGTVVKNYDGLGGYITLVTVAAGGTPVSDATVTVNTINVPNTAPGNYALVGGLTISTGDDVTLLVTRLTRTVTATLKMPEQPVVTQPDGSGSPYSASASMFVQWDSFVTDPDSLMVEVHEDFTPPADGRYLGSVPFNTDTDFTIPADTFDPAASSAEVEVEARNVTTSLGTDAEPGSVYNVGQEGFSTTFDMQ